MSSFKVTAVGVSVKISAASSMIMRLAFSANELGAVEDRGRELSEMVRTARDTLLQGDFWPGNILIRTAKVSECTQSKTRVDRIFVVDWELVRPGFPAFEVGQFLAELHQVQRFGAPEICPSVVSLRTSFLQAYKAGIRVDISMEKIARVAMAHMGAHLIGWAPRIWTLAEKEKVREVVAEGVTYLLTASSRQIVDSSPFGILTSKD